MKIKPHVKDVLLVLGLGALVVGSVIAPGLPKIIFYLKKQNKSTQRKLENFNHRLFNQELKRLEKIGDVIFAEENGKVIASLTKKGETRINKYDFDDMKISKPAKWDGKWRMVIFDISEDKKVARELLRKKLKELGFYKLQKSVYIHPYPCREEITVLRENYNLDKKQVLYLLVDTFEGKNIGIQSFK